MQVTSSFPLTSSPSGQPFSTNLCREVVFCGVCRSLALLASLPTPSALLLLPASLRPTLDSALSALVDLLDGTQPAPTCTATERSFLATLPSSIQCEDLARVSIKYLAAARSAPSSSSSSSSSAASSSEITTAPDLLSYACAFHAQPQASRPSWVGLIAPELLLGAASGSGSQPCMDATALNAAMALLSGAPNRPTLHLYFLAPLQDSPAAVARALHRAAFPLLAAAAQ